ncbi:MAG: hypothetical protein K5848_05275 [Lachnospiraceae bacterium]|nr:hypothetical protein [Lachnospiraceae bacterium]
MKKYILFLALGIMVMIGTAFADETERNDGSDFTAVNEQLYLDSLEENFTDYESRIEFYTISQEVVDSCSTEELLELMLSCPLLCNINIYDSKEMGLESLINDFNYFEEFVNREDALEVTLEAYNNYDIPVNTNINYDLIVRETTKSLDINVLARNKSLAVYVHRDAMVEYSIDMLEELICYWKTNEQLSEDEENYLALAISNMYEKECNSKYYEYGNRLSSLVNNSINQRILPELNSRYTVYTPSGYAVSATYSSSQTVNSVYTCTQLATTYNMILDSVSVKECNCHSYAWISKRPAYSGNYTHIWIDNVSLFSSDNYYSSSSSVHAVGDIANRANIHSAFVYALNQYNSSNGLYETKYRSKWGTSGIFIHFMTGTPYSGSYYYYWH